MARVDYDPTPSVEARTSAPEDYQNIHASPEAFGAGVGQGLEQVGQVGIDASKFYGRVAADNATNNTLDQVGAIMNGQPGKTSVGADGQPVQDTGFLGLRGADAMSAWGDTQKSIDKVIADNRKGLTTPVAQYQYDVDTRRYRAEWLRQVGTHADQQQRVWAKDTNDTSATLAMNDLGAKPMDDASVADATSRLTNAYVKNAQMEGVAPAGAVLKAQQDAAITRVRSLIVKDPVSAQKVFDQNSNLLGSLPNYDGISRQVKGAVIDATMSPAIDKAVGDARAGAQASTVAPNAVKVAPEALHTAILGQESGNNSSAAVSVDGARGPGQITPGTFAKFAKPGETIDNPADNRAVSARALDYYQDKYGDAGRAAVAYFSGEGNVAAPGSATPWKRDAHDGNGKSTSSYVTDVEQRLGLATRYPSTADALTANMPATLDKAQKDAEQLFPNYPDAQERYVEGVHRRLDQTITQQHQQYEVDTHTVQAVMASDHPPISEEQLLATSPDVASAWRSMQVNNPYGAMGIEKMFDANAKGRALGYGTDFKTYLDRVLAPSTDPDRVTNASQLWGLVGTGDHAPLTNSGVNQLSGLLQGRGTPQGEANAAALHKFVDDMHATLTFSNKGTGVYDAKGEAKFSQFMAGALPVLAKAQQSGTLPNLLNPNSKDYIGQGAAAFTRSQSDMMADRLKAQTGATALPAYTVQSLGRTLNELDNDDQRREALKAAVQQKRISLADATTIGVERGYIQGQDAKLAAPLYVGGVRVH